MMILHPMLGDIMKPEHIASVGVLVASGLLLAAVQAVPPLTSVSVPPPPPQQARVITARIDEAAYCRDQLTKVDCGCFTYRAGLVLNAGRTPLPGLSYADRWELALSQASKSCATGT